MFRSILSLVGLVALASSSPLSTHSVPHSDPKGSDLRPVIPSLRNPIENSYIVVLNDQVSPSTFLAHTQFVEFVHYEKQRSDNKLADLDSGLSRVYDSDLLKGYAGVFHESTIEQIRSRPEVQYIEQDQLVHATNITTQRGAPWGLARVSHRNKLSFGTFQSYNYDTEGGEGVDVYIIDTGVNIAHVEFEGRAKWGKTIPKNDQDIDGNGHGTHCAGTIGSRKYGVAKQANLFAVKVLGTDGSGTMSDVIDGVIWAATQASKKAIEAAAEVKATGTTRHKGSVANMSLGGGKSTTLDVAVNRAVDGGLHFAVAAGNDNRDACDYSPAGAEKAVTVGASTLGDERAYFSNFGQCVDVFAPGLNILSTWTGSNKATNTISGTSMASPHVAGLIAYFLSLYPSKSFNIPAIESQQSALLVAASETIPGFGAVQRVYSAARSRLPAFIAERLPSLEEPVAPIPPVITPKVLKEALLALASEGKLTKLPDDGTPNLLVFNNATSA
ncbi:hypothetical protein M422DRAFT_244537 [Sphaerobolus stellatus SS14]|nr:hypothetical protein M422DRAFT_244537 [Sphaerobolus stellatus SS14]